jgi:hypothetical protein
MRQKTILRDMKRMPLLSWACFQALYTEPACGPA